MFLLLADFDAFLIRGGARGVVVGDRRNWILSLCYADDLALLAESPKALQVAMRLLAACTGDNWNEVSVEKSKVMVFRRAGRFP